MKAPLLLLDVDGVLCPFGGDCDAGLLHGPTGVEHIRYAAQLPCRLERLAEHFQLVWATAWEDEANDVLADALRLPQLPVIRFDDSTGPGESWKLPAIRRFVRDRPFAWIDDDIGFDAHAWAAGRGVPTLMLDILADRGLLEPDVARLLAFAAELSA